MPEPLSGIARFTAVLFDMDGVVIDSEPVSAIVMKEAAESFGFTVPDGAMDSYKGLPGDVVYKRVAREHGFGAVDGPTLRAVRDRLYEQRLPDIPLMPGARRLITALVRSQHPLALVTSSRRRHARIVIESHDLTTCFPVVLGSEDVARPKPDPAPYLAAAGVLDVFPSDCVAVEDSVNGVLSASAAGCRVVGFGTEFSADALRSAGAHVLCRDHAGLAYILGLG